MFKIKINDRTKQLHEICALLNNATKANWYIDYSINDISYPDALHTLNSSNMILSYSLYSYLHNNNNSEINYFVLKKKIIQCLDNILRQYNFSYNVSKDIRHDCCNLCDESSICDIKIFFDEDNTFDAKFNRAKQYLFNNTDDEIISLLNNDKSSDDKSEQFKMFSYITDYLNGYTDLIWYIDNNEEFSIYCHDYTKHIDKDNYKEKIIKLLNNIIHKFNINYEFHYSFKTYDYECCYDKVPIYEIKINKN